MALNAVQSAEDKQPLVLALAVPQVIFGVVPWLDDNGDDAVTEVTVPPPSNATRLDIVICLITGVVVIPVMIFTISVVGVVLVVTTGTEDRYVDNFSDAVSASPTVANRRTMSNPQDERFITNSLQPCTPWLLMWMSPRL